MMTTGEILRAAAQQVRYGWCQGTLMRGESVCAFGAIINASGADSLVQEIFGTEEINTDAVADFVERALGLRVVNELRPLAAWNDLEGQTAENVAAGLERAADRADEEDALKLTPPVQWTHRDTVATTGAGHPA